MVITQEELLAFKPIDVAKARGALQEQGIKNVFEGGGAFTQIGEHLRDLSVMKGDLANPNITAGQRANVLERGALTVQKIRELQNVLPQSIVQSSLGDIRAENLDVPGLEPQGQASFADIRAGGDPNDYITIEKGGKQRQVTRSQLSDSFAKAGFKIVGETGKQRIPEETITQTQPNFIAGLTQAQKDSITNLMSARPSSQWSETDIKNWNYATGGQALPSGFPEKKPSDVMTPDKMEGAAGFNIPGGGADSSGLANALVMGANTSIAEIMKQLTPPETAVDQKQQALLDNMAGLVGDQAQMAADQLTAEQSAGLPELRQQFADINAQILSKTAEYNVLQTANQNKPITMNTIIGNERAIMNAQAADIGLLQARALGLQGQIETAQATADRAIDLKYSTIQAQLDVYQAQLNAIQPELNKQEKQQAMAQQLLLDQRQQALEDKKTEEKNIQGLMLEAVNAGITDLSVLNQISEAKSYTEAIKLLGKNMPTENSLMPQKIGQDSNGNDIFSFNGEIVTGDELLGVMPPDTLAEFSDPVAYDWAVSIRDGQAKLSDLTGDPDLKSRVVSIQRTLPPSDAAIKSAEDMVTKLKDLLNHEGLNVSVGPRYSGLFTRTDWWLNQNKDAFLGKADQVISQEALSSLIEAKSQGATFGALSDTEMEILRSAATAMGAWELSKDGKLTGFKVDEESFKAEVNKLINDYEDLLTKAKDPLQLFNSSLNVSSDVSGIKDGAKVSTVLGQGTATGIQRGSSAWDKGFDFVLSGGKGASVPSPVGGKVVFAGKNGRFGNQVKIKTADGKEIWLSHLDAINVKSGQTITPNMIIGKQGNTGTVLSGTGSKLTSAQIAQGRGTHLDITIKKPDGTYYTSQEVASMLGTRLS